MLLNTVSNSFENSAVLVRATLKLGSEVLVGMIRLMLDAYLKYKQSAAAQPNAVNNNRLALKRWKNNPAPKNKTIIWVEWLEIFRRRMKSGVRNMQTAASRIMPATSVLDNHGFLNRVLDNMSSKYTPLV